ncbi:hypothetical protein HPP92_005386 [Vanilla planifolia]|uniref:Uncharacterized protein n=1 Tax=Vanilla planifolia TaxID=51239 RepID=A0A835VD54_VANPL|nr:hypothetical protein HPP92_005386 [Vanilla planifolia]
MPACDRFFRERTAADLKEGGRGRRRGPAPLTISMRIAPSREAAEANGDLGMPGLCSQEKGIAKEGIGWKGEGDAEAAKEDGESEREEAELDEEEPRCREGRRPSNNGDGDKEASSCRIDNDGFGSISFIQRREILLSLRRRRRVGRRKGTEDGNPRKQPSLQNTILFSRRAKIFRYVFH